MALSSDFRKQQTSQDLEAQLESLEKLLERTKVLFEQYFMGIQRVAPTQLHREIERRVRELTQHQVRNTALRFRLTTLTQKFGSYNTYWKRTLRQIEQGTYIRDLARVSRKALAHGEDLPEELLVKLPKLVQNRILRDRARLAARAQEQAARQEERDADQAQAGEDDRPNPHVTEIGEDDAAEAEALFSGGDLDMDELFGGLTQDEAAAPEPSGGGVRRTQAIEPADSKKRTQAISPLDLPGGPTQAIEPADSKKRTQALSQRLTQAFEPPEQARDDDAPAEGKAGQAPRTTTPVVPPPGARPGGGRTIRFAPPVPGPAGGKSAGAPAGAGRPPAPKVPPPIKRTQVLTPPPIPRAGPAAPPRAAQSAGGPPPPRPPAGMDEKQCRDLYTRYIKAKKLVGEKTDGISYDKLVSSLGKQAPSIMKQHGARGVQYSVVVRGEKVILKAKPIK